MCYPCQSKVENYDRFVFNCRLYRYKSISIQIYEILKFILFYNLKTLHRYTENFISATIRNGLLKKFKWQNRKERPNEQRGYMDDKAIIYSFDFVMDGVGE